MAANGFDVDAVFGCFFGDKVALIENNVAFPEVNVLSNTFDNIDIVVTGIVGDKSLMFISMDLIKKDGGSFSEEERESFNGFVTLKEFNDAAIKESNKNVDDYLLEDEEGDFVREGTDIGSSCTSLFEMTVDDVDYEQATRSSFRTVYNDEESNKLSIAYVVSIEASVDGEVRKVPGESYFIRIKDLVDEDNFGDGLWEAEFTANYTESEPINLDVNKVAHMPKWETDDEYVEEADMLVNTIELSPLTLRYVCEYDNTFDVENQDWPQFYILMEDGSLAAGYKAFDMYHDSAWNGTLLGSSGIKEDDGPWEKEIVFNEPIDITKVKEIHFGDLVIDVK